MSALRGKEGVCRIEVAKVEWVVLQPWQRAQQTKSSGTGFVIDGERLLTNAHVVKSAVDIRVRQHGSTRRFPAQVVVYAPDVDLALLEIKGEQERADFFAKRPCKSLALELAEELPALQEAVHVVGFPTGGRTICITEGVVSRIDLVDASVFNQAIVIQVDSAINPGNSGGPAFNKLGQVTGVAFRKRVKNQTSQTVDNIGYLIPAMVVRAFLGRCCCSSSQKAYTYTLSPCIPYRWHTLENKSLRLAHAVPHHVHGILLTSVCESFHGVLQQGDVLTKIDGKNVADDGQVVLRGEELIRHAFLLRVKRVDEPVVFSVYRHGKHTTCPPRVLRDIPSIIPRWDDVDFQPEYLILGAVVLLPFSWPLRSNKKCGSRLTADCIDWYQKWPGEWEGKEGLVVLTDIFAHELSFSYARLWRRVIAYNGVPIRSLAHVRELWDASCKAVVKQEEEEEEGETKLSFATLSLENDNDVVFEVKAAMKAQAELLVTHQISEAARIIPPNPKYKR